jgi:hypothetical protein
MSPYQRINLNLFLGLSTPLIIKDFFTKFEAELHAIYKKYKEGLFYVEYGPAKELRIAQKYTAKVPTELYQLFNSLSDIIKFDYTISESYQQVPTKHEPAYPDYVQPGRINTMISRIIRDTKLVRDIKREFSWKCQICGKRILLPNGEFYAEGHHIKPLGIEYNGPDTKDNIIILCPYHHTEFDYGSIAIDPKTKKVLHLDKSNEFYNKDLAYVRNDLNSEFLDFHVKKIFIQK